MVIPKLKDDYKFERRMGVISAEVESPNNEKGDARLNFVHASGYEVSDSHNNVYVDLINGKGSILLGHNNQKVNNSIVSLLQNDYNIHTGPNDLVIELGEKIVSCVKIEKPKVAFFSTGTAACRAAACLARAKTNRQIILSSGYHGWDPMWYSSGKILEPNNDGVVDFYFIPELLEMYIKDNKNKVALIMISPDYVYLLPETLIQIVDIAKRNNILICLDDVKQGFRYRYGASIEMITKTPMDLYTFSKGLANGNRISCLVGSSDLMIESKEYTYTSYYDLIPFAASLETLNQMKSNDGYTHIDIIGKRIADQLATVFSESKLPIAVKGRGAMFQFVFGNDGLKDRFYREAINQQLLLFEDDNQAVSFCFDEDAVTRIIKSVKRINTVLSAEFIHLLNSPISNEQIFKSAWNMIDGAADIATFDEKIKWIYELI